VPRQAWCILNDDDVPVAQPDVDRWFAWWERNRHRRGVALTAGREWRVLTVFLGVNCNPDRWDVPLVFETWITREEFEGMRWKPAAVR
jgi:hypothetical protein